MVKHGRASSWQGVEGEVTPHNPCQSLDCAMCHILTLRCEPTHADFTRGWGRSGGERHQGGGYEDKVEGLTQKKDGDEARVVYVYVYVYCFDVISGEAGRGEVLTA